MNFRVVLYAGTWKRRPPTEAVLRQCLRWFFGTELGKVRFVESDEDIAVEANFSAFLEDETHGDIVCDELCVDLLRRMEPEFETMVEVEVLDNDWCVCGE
ncbi:MAG: hypothetical protein ABFC88_12745 [Thermoguttaceae bacterium]